jgi:hypothetical protein
MAATAVVAVKLTVTPTTGTPTEGALSFTSSVAPYEVSPQRAVVANSAFNIDFGHIAAGSGYLLWVYAITGNFYFKFNSASGDPVLTDSHLYVREGEAYPIPINPNSTAFANGIRGISDSATGEIEYFIVGIDDS